MRLFISFFGVLMLMLTLTPLASAGFTVANDSDVKIEVIYGYWDGDQSLFRMRGYYHIPPNESISLWTPAGVTEVFARIWPQTQNYVVEHDRDSYEFTVHPRLPFDIFSEADGTIVESNVPHDELVTRGDFYEYANNTTFRFTALASGSFTVANDSDVKISVIYGYWDGDQSRFRIRGYYHIPPNESKSLWAPAKVTEVFARIWTQADVVKHDRDSYQSSKVHPRLAFDVFYKQDGTIVRSDVPHDELVTRSDFYKYANNTTFRYQPGNGSVNIPDPNLRAAIEKALGKTSGATITRADMETLTELSASNKGVQDLSNEDVQDLTGIEFATNLTELYLDYNEVSDVSALASLTNLEVLVLTGNEVSDVSALGGLTNLTELSLQWNQVSDVSPLASLTNLTKLSLLGNQVSDIFPLVSLTNLTKLYLHDNRVSDISPLVSLTNLRRLSLHDNQISDVSPLANLKNLTHLNLAYNKISDFSPIAGLIPNLESYSHSGQRVVDPNTAVNIPDPNLRAALAKELGKASGATITRADMLTLTKLDASSRSIQDLTGLEFAINLTTLSLYDNEVSDISALGGLTKLGWLDISYNEVSDVSALGSLTNLDKLFLISNRISDVSALGGLTNLTSLRLNSNRISDVSALGGLTNLGKLFLHDNEVSDVSALGGLTNLWSLYLSDNEISDVSPLASLTKVTDLDLASNQISDFSPIAGLIPNLFYYTNKNQRVESGVDPNAAVNIPDPDLRAGIEKKLGKASGATITVADMRTLKESLVIYTGGIHKSNIQDLTGIEFATNLERLYLFRNQISDVSPLASLTNLTELLLHENEISDVSPLASLTNLRWLSLYDNQVSDVSALSSLTNLETLSLYDNQVSDVSALSSLTNLETLSLFNNQISDVSALSSLTNLDSLWLDGNEISDVSALSSLTNLDSLWLDGNEISDVSALSSLTNLKKLYLSGNQVSDVSPLASLTNLTELYLDENEISDFSPIASLIPNLRTYTPDTLSNLLDPKLRKLRITVNIPDPKLRITLEKELFGFWFVHQPNSKRPTITRGDMLRLINPQEVSGGISDLTGLEFALNLEEFSIPGFKGHDLSPLAGLKKLKVLHFYHPDYRQLSDLSPLADLENLEELYITECKVSDISPLANLKKMTSLGLGYNQIFDISPLSGLENLTYLDLSSNQISDVSPLANLINLRHLDLSDNQIADFSAIEELIPNLESYNGGTQGGVRIFMDDYIALPGGGYADISHDKGSVFIPGSKHQLILTIKRNSKPVQGLHIVLTATADNSSASASFSPSTITTNSYGKASTYITFGKGVGDIKIHAKTVNYRETNRYDATVYKHPDGNETVLIKGLELSGVSPFVYYSDYTQFLPPKNGKHFEIYTQKGSTCGQYSALMLLHYYGVDVSKDTFDDVADIVHTWWGTTPTEMMNGLRLLPVDVEHFKGTHAGYPRYKSLRDKISESRPPIIVIRLSEIGYHHVVVVGYDTKTDEFLIADPNGAFLWVDYWEWTKVGRNPETGRDVWYPPLNDAWYLDYQKEDLDNWADVWVIPDMQWAGQLFGDNLAPYRMFVPKQAPPYHHLESETRLIYETGDVEYNPLDWGWDDWKRTLTFRGKVVTTSWFAEYRNGDVRDVAKEGNKVIVSGRIANGVPLDADIPFVDELFFGAVDMVLTVYYDPNISAAPSVVLPASPMATTLLANYPNPFNPETWIPYHLSKPAEVVLTIYSVDGKVVRRLDLGYQAAGFYDNKSRAAYWDGRNSVGERVASGVYFYTLTAGDFAATQKMLIMK